MIKSQVNVATRSRDYGSSWDFPSLESPPPLKMPLQIKKLEPPPRIPKGVLKFSTHNPNARAAQNYSIIEDLGQTPCAMSALEVLQTCPSQRNSLLSTLGSLDPCGSKVIKFDVTDVKPCLPYHVAFQIHVDYSKYSIKHIVIDEGVATCVMSLTCWKSIVSPTLSQSPTMLTTFDGRSFCPHGILPTFLVQLGGKMVEVDFEVFDVPLDYNLLLGYNCTYVMTTVVSSVFRNLCFPRNGKIVMIDQLSFAHAIPNALVGPSILVIDNSQLETKDIDVIMYSSLMGNFDFMEPIHSIYVMSNRSSLSMRFVPFRTSYFNDPWTLPSSTSSCEGQSHIGMEISLSVAKIAYQVVLDSSFDLDHVSSQKDEEDHVLKNAWATSSSCSHDSLDDTLPLDEAIVEVMNVSDRPWDDMHHRFYFLPELARIEQDDFISTLSEIVDQAIVPLDTHRIYVEGNMASISPTVTIDISRIPGKVENVYIGVHSSFEEIQSFSRSYKKRPRIDPRFECKIPSLRLSIKLLPDTFDLKQRLIHLESLDEQC
jgi:hypothetical protein